MSELVQKVEILNDVTDHLDAFAQETKQGEFAHDDTRGEAEVQDGADPPSATSQRPLKDSSIRYDPSPTPPMADIDTDPFHRESQRLQEALEAMLSELKCATEWYTQAKYLSDARSNELVATQLVQPRVDEPFISELVQKVDGLNGEIYHVAALLGESIVQKQVELPEQTHDSSEENATAKALLGSPLYKILQNKTQKIDKETNILLVQITLQTFFSMFCIHRIRSWTPSQPTSDAVLHELYEKIWSSNDQAVSGPWRSLTRAQLKPDANEWTKELMTELDAILALAWWEMESPEVRHTLEARLPAIFKIVLDVREAVGEKFTSAEIEITSVEPQTAFNKAHMKEDYAWDLEGHQKPEVVIATVGMGVRKVVTIEGGRDHEYVLGPKVVLESSLMAALEPQSPRPIRRKAGRP